MSDGSDILIFYLSGTGFLLNSNAQNFFPGCLVGIWKERNARCFEGKIIIVVILIDHLNIFTASWVFVIPFFHNISIDVIVHNWRDVAFSRAEI